jgi:hypothetical protein
MPAVKASRHASEGIVGAMKSAIGRKMPYSLKPPILEVFKREVRMAKPNYAFEKRQKEIAKKKKKEEKRLQKAGTGDAQPQDVQPAFGSDDKTAKAGGV